MIGTFLTNYRKWVKTKKVLLSKECIKLFPLTTLVYDFLDWNILELFNDYRYTANDNIYFLEAVTSGKSFLYYDLLYNKSWLKDKKIYKLLFDWLKLNKDNFFILSTLWQLLCNKWIAKWKYFFEKALLLDSNNVHLLSNLARYIWTTFFEENNSHNSLLVLSHKIIQKAYNIDYEHKYIWLVAWLWETYRKNWDLNSAEKYLLFSNKLMKDRNKYYYLPDIWYWKVLLSRWKYNESLKVFLWLLKFSDNEIFHLNLYKFISYNYIKLSDQKNSIKFLTYFLYQAIQERGLNITFNNHEYIITKTNNSIKLSIDEFFLFLNKILVNWQIFNDSILNNKLWLTLYWFNGVLISLNEMLFFLKNNILNLKIHKNKSVFLGDDIIYIFLNLK
jgi:hypothetical protein